MPIVREPDGLALSSRNVRLDPDDRDACRRHLPITSRGRSRIRVGRDATRRRSGGSSPTGSPIEPRASVEYVEVVDALTLEPVERAEPPTCVLTAAWFGDVRLIDNALLDQ